MLYSFEIYFRMLKSCFENSSAEALPFRFPPSKDIYEQVGSRHSDLRQLYQVRSFQVQVHPSQINLDKDKVA